MADTIAESRENTTGTVLFIGSDVLGRGDDQQLGSLLMQKFLHTLSGLPDRPEAVLLVNNGVRLATDESVISGELRQLQDQGVEIRACATCLSRFQLTDKVTAGWISDMNTIVSKLLNARKVISM
jgi:selenium metabolism protein YedF